MRRTRILDALNSHAAMEHTLVKGWIRTRRDSKGFSFLEVNDGSCLKNLQVIVDASSPASATLSLVATGAAIEVEGALVASPGKGQQWELHATTLHLLGLDHTKLTYKFQGRHYRLTDVHGKPVENILRGPRLTTNTSDHVSDLFAKDRSIRKHQ